MLFVPSPQLSGSVKERCVASNKILKWMWKEGIREEKVDRDRARTCNLLIRAES